MEACVPLLEQLGSRVQRRALKRRATAVVLQVVDGLVFALKRAILTVCKSRSSDGGAAADI